MLRRQLFLSLIAAAASLTLLGGCSIPSGAVQQVTPLPQTAFVGTAAATPALQASFTAQMDESQQGNPEAVTPTPLDLNLLEGQARAIAAATDAALQPTPRSVITFDSEPVRIRFDEFYDGYNLRTGLLLSDKLVSLDGRQAVLEGYMAPPLKPELDYFVLTRVKLAFCPFCSTASDWPDDIALIYMPDGMSTVATDRPVRITGRLEIGQSVDQETGMVSLVRLYADLVEALG
ncbi:MAG: hypothetical protein L6Q98_06685 [Anaerolineae bacterium]|nr:hypothetical protein [Anaerolineae bacterium]NUQ02870.1 hypothetical protein [Anaerolineae bacterium]